MTDSNDTIQISSTMGDKSWANVAIRALHLNGLRRLNYGDVCTVRPHLWVLLDVPPPAQHVITWGRRDLHLLDDGPCILGEARDLQTEHVAAAFIERRRELQASAANRAIRVGFIVV